MKKTIIYIAAIVLGVNINAQSLAMPDLSDDQTDEAAVAEQPTTTVPEEQPRHNTPSSSYKSERNAIRKGNAAFDKKLYHEALEHYNDALKINAGSIRGRYNKAVALLQLQSDDNKGTENDPRVAAHSIFEEVITDAKYYDKPIAEKSFYNLGNMEFNDERYDNSIEYYKSALRINPDNMEARENLRLAQLKKQQQENQDQNQEQNQDKQEQQQEQQQQQEQNQQEEPQEQQPQPQEPKPMTQSAQQILQSMQNKENQTRKKVKEQEPPARRQQSDKPW
ncbi:MAG: tetratricopeptide repeat protein [Muribaculaceae bacterium]|nr:tetratricopeptide repeat protein [Muribaculaceae bacterium]